MVKFILKYKYLIILILLGGGLIAYRTIQINDLNVQIQSYNWKIDGLKNQISNAQSLLETDSGNGVPDEFYYRIPDHFSDFEISRDVSIIELLAQTNVTSRDITVADSCAVYDGINDNLKCVNVNLTVNVQDVDELLRFVDELQNYPRLYIVQDIEFAYGISHPHDVDIQIMAFYMNDGTE